MAVVFRQLIERLRARIKAQIRNGEMTERGLARRVGLSQSHVHNVLKGARILTPKTADRILTGLRLSVLDLLPEEERERLACKRRKGQD